MERGLSMMLSRATDLTLSTMQSRIPLFEARQLQQVYPVPCSPMTANDLSYEACFEWCPVKSTAHTHLKPNL